MNELNKLNMNDNEFDSVVVYQIFKYYSFFSL